MKIKKIKYIDSNQINEQSDIIAESSVITAVGFVIKETDEYITLARELMSDDEYRGQISIPKIAIKKITCYKIE